MSIDQVVQAEIELLTAIKNADVAVLKEMLHDDLLFNLPNGQTITKEFDLDSYRSGKMNIHTLEATDQIINIIEDSVVVCVTVALKGSYESSPLDGVFRYIRVWKQFQQELKVIAGSCIVLQ